MNVAQAIESNSTTKRGWGLIRVSTTTQANVQHGSLEQQRHMLERWAEREGLKNGHAYQIERIVEEDISGRQESLHKRSGYQELVRAIKSKQVDFVVFEKIDRLGRSKIENQRFVELAEETGVEVYEVESGLINLKDRGSRLSFNIKNMFAEEYSLELEEKIAKKQREARVNNGKDTSTWPVLGLDAHPVKTGMYVINPIEQKTIQEIFNTYLKIGSLKALSLLCQEKGYKTKTRMTKEKIDKTGTKIPPRKIGGDPLTPKRLFQLLTNSKYRGHGYFQDTWNQFPERQDKEGFVRFDYAHGPVIDSDLFERTQALLYKNAQKYMRGIRKNTIYLLSGILCLPDGRLFQGASAKGGESRYYQDPDHKIRIRKEKIEALVCARVKAYLQEKGLLQRVLNSNLKNQKSGNFTLEDEIQKARKQIAQLEKIIDGFTQSIRQIVIENPSLLSQVTITLIGEKSKAETELAQEKKRLAQMLIKKTM